MFQRVKLPDKPHEGLLPSPRCYRLCAAGSMHRTKNTTPGASPRASGTFFSPASVPFLLMSSPAHQRMVGETAVHALRVAAKSQEQVCSRSNLCTGGAASLRQ